MTERLKVEIDRARWLRGEGPHNSSLQRLSDGKRCCVGFMCLAAGATEAQIAGQDNPAKFTDRVGPWFHGKYGDAVNVDTEVGRERLRARSALYVAFAINDAPVGEKPCVSSLPTGTTIECLARFDGPIRDDADREERLVRLAAEHGVDLEFVG